jgi:hypothetical protein
MKSLFFTSLFILVSYFNTFAQNGIVKGRVLDKNSKEEMIGAKVIILNTNFRTLTDIYGTFTFNMVPNGDYEIEISYASYATDKRKISVSSDKPVVIEVEMVEAIKELDAVTITAKKKTNTESAVIMEIKEAKAVVSGISKEQISRSQDKNAAEVMQRIPGVTIIENRFAMIRGVNSRYNSVMINNITAPSTEIDRKTFSFDLISSGALDRMLVYKSASPEYPGDFAGGVIKLFTINTPDEDFMTFKMDVGYRSNTTFNTYKQSKGSSTDFLGFDNNFRPLPSLFPTRTRLAQESKVSELRRDAALMLNNNFNPTEGIALPDLGLGFGFGKTFKVGEKTISTVNNINYSQGYQYFARDFYRYDVWTNLNAPINPRFRYVDETFQKDNKINIMSNWNIRLNDKTKLKFSNLFNQIGENETIIRNGEDFQQRPGDDLRNYLLGYKSRTIYTGQLEGIHNLGKNNKKELSWVLGASYIGESEPDLRRFRTFKAREDSSYIAQFSPSSNLFDNSRYYGNLSEYTISNGMNYSHQFANEENGKKFIKVGYYGDYRSRSFNSRYFSYTYPGFFDPVFYDSLILVGPSSIFSHENFRTEDGLVIEEGTRPIDSYTASNLLVAGYIATDLTFGKTNVSGGVRVEQNIQKMNSRDDFGPITVNNPILSVLPSINAGYNLSKKSLIRGGYGRTINRPEFRELAPFLFYDYKLESSRVGNPELKTATIDNFDLRYEFYPRPGETYSVGGFYKRFKNPIEDRLILTTEQSSLTYVNADYAFNYGIEVEIKQSLKDIFASSFLNKLTLNLNASYIFSEVDLGATAVAQDRIRALQGQAPYIVNGAIYYNNNKSGINASFVYNVVGRNIFAVGDISFPTIYELERHSLDFTIGKSFKNGINAKFGVQNILNFPYRFFQDSDRDGKIDTSVDHPVFVFKRGALFTFGISYNFLGKKK